MQARNFIKKETLEQVFSCEFCEICQESVVLLDIEEIMIKMTKSKFLDSLKINIAAEDGKKLFLEKIHQTVQTL